MMGYTASSELDADLVSTPASRHLGVSDLHPIPQSVLLRQTHTLSFSPHSSLRISHSLE